MQVLIIDDDNQFAGALADYLELKGVECDFAYNGLSGLSLAQKGNADVIILDVNMPKMDGYEVCRMLRDARVLTPILMMTAYDTVEDELEGFLSGVDDFVVKPCPMPVVWARLQALSKRTQPKVACHLTIGELELDLSTQEATRAGKKLKMTPIGWKILHYLVIQSPRVVPRVELQNTVWPDDPIEPGNLNVQLSNLRKVLDKPFSSPLLHTRINAGIQIKELE